ncbi:MAG TPA: alpha-E domain-containing protein, partial [Candidatus Elarobacter sp.]|nr:alpha-E domain-containing protein [Candidatus Elarobacter sp.]
LYWTARNVERAEDLARLIDITATRSVDRAVDAESRWRAAYAVAGIEPPEGEIERNDAIERIVFGAETLLSITSCVRIARRNAVGVRAELTTEIWECINGLYLFVEAQSLRAIGPDGASSFLHAIRESAQAFGGICDATLAREDAWMFLRIGRYLERAAMTARVLRAMEPDAGQHVWQLVLEACCASEPYARARQQSFDPGEALAFLALSITFPRSLRFCLHEVDHALHRLSGAPVGTFATAAERTSGQIASSLDFAGATDLAREGTASVAERISAALDELGSAITSAYFPRVPVG